MSGQEGSSDIHGSVGGEKCLETEAEEQTEQIKATEAAAITERCRSVWQIPPAWRSVWDKTDLSNGI